MVVMVMMMVVVMVMMMTTSDRRLGSRARSDRLLSGHAVEHLRHAFARSLSDVVHGPADLAHKTFGACAGGRDRIVGFRNLSHGDAAQNQTDHQSIFSDVHFYLGNHVDNGRKISCLRRQAKAPRLRGRRIAAFWRFNSAREPALALLD